MREQDDAVDLEDFEKNFEFDFVDITVHDFIAFVLRVCMYTR